MPTDHLRQMFAVKGDVHRTLALPRLDGQHRIGMRGGIVFHQNTVRAAIKIVNGRRITGRDPIAKLEGIGTVATAGMST